MDKKLKLVLLVVLLAGAGLLATHFLKNNPPAVLHPKGIIASQELNLMITATLLMLIVVVPVFILTGVIAWRYREGNHKARYQPDWDHHLGLEALWWVLPCAIIAVLSLITWRSTHQLDPFKPLQSNKPPLTIQVVALQWKWLFIYPEHNMASVNYVQFPAGTPVNFQITSDAPMNSFWIPQLGGQVYAMAGMKSQLHLMANEPGSFRGVSSNLSGAGFSRMNFTAKASSSEDFYRWIAEVKKSPGNLNWEEYGRLTKPSQSNPATYYSSAETGLYNKVVMKYMGPPADLGGGHMHAVNHLSEAGAGSYAR
jgi:cytochrome o ubiquinol oxidase subunit 2